MKITAFLLLILIIGSSVFYYGYFDIMLLYSKHRASCGVAAAKHNSSFNVIKVPLNQQDAYSGDEIRIDGNLYDVGKREIINDTLFLSLYHDTDEQDILSEISDFFKADDVSVSEFPKSSSLKNVRIIYNPQYCFHALLFSFQTGTHANTGFFYNTIFISSAFSDVITPPPRLS